MSKVKIRKMTVSDIDEIRDICYETGYMGRDLSNLKVFRDKKLFCLLFCDYYLYFEPHHCFVAVKDTDEVLGYVIGTSDTHTQEKQYSSKMIKLILKQIFRSTLWKNPKIVMRLFYFLLFASKKGNSIDLRKYPAHLHINVSHKAQRKGVGATLMDAFENHLRELQVSGIHLTTTMGNTKAIPFYEKLGYSMIAEKSGNMWRVKGFNTITFAKEL